jgi:hypothetical protein
MVILGIAALMLVAIGLLTTIFIFTNVSDGTGNETGLIANLMLVYGSIPITLLGVFFSLTHTLISIFS